MTVYTDKQLLEQLDNTIAMLQGLRNVVLEKVDPLPDEQTAVDLEGDPEAEPDVESEEEVPFLTQAELEAQQQNEPEKDPVGYVRAVMQEMLTDPPTGFDDDLMMKVWENTKGDREKIEAAFYVLQDKIDNDVVRSPGGLLFTLSRSKNILSQKRAIDNRSEEDTISEATRAAKKRMDEKIKGRPIRGDKAKPKTKPNFKELAQQLYGGGKSGSD